MTEKKMQLVDCKSAWPPLNTAFASILRMVIIARNVSSTVLESLSPQANDNILYADYKSAQGWMTYAYAS